MSVLDVEFLEQLLEGTPELRTSICPHRVGDPHFENNFLITLETSLEEVCLPMFSHHI